MNRLRRWSALFFSRDRAWRSGGLIGLSAIALVVLARMSGALQPLEWMAFDTLMRLRPAESMEDRVVVIGIDDQDIEQLKTYPVPDQELAALITTVQQFQPAAIGIDIFRDLPVEPGRKELIKTFQKYPNTIIIERVKTPGDVRIRPLKQTKPEQVGFANILLDNDGYLRRNLIALEDPIDNRTKFSFAHQLSKLYLTTQGYELQDSEILEYAKTQSGQAHRKIAFPPIDSETGAYIRTESGGYQTLLNFRSGSQPFRVLSLRQVKSGQIRADWIRGKVVLVGITGKSVKDFVSVGAAVWQEQPSTYFGVIMQAHAVSQEISTVINQRPLLQTWLDPWEYSWIGVWGIIGISLGFLRSPWQILFSTGGMSFLLIGVCYGALLLGWWIPLVPAMMGLIFNGAGLAAALLYRDQQELEARELIRQQTVEKVFSMIHNGPLQQLARLLRQAQDQADPDQKWIGELSQLNQSLRSLQQTIGQVAQCPDQIIIGTELVDLNAPLDELLQLVCDATLTRTQEFPHFQTIRHHIIEISPLRDRALTLEQRGHLCQFLEEALGNVGKHAMGATQLWVFCGQENDRQVIRVKDNGNTTKLLSKRPRGMGGTQLAKILERQLKGKFQRLLNQPQGIICELIWKS